MALGHYLPFPSSWAEHTFSTVEALSAPQASTTCVQQTSTQTVSDSAGVSDSDATWATLALAERSAEIVAVEPDPQMAQVARRRTEGLPVQVVESTFEGFAADPGTFDLLVSAQAWHWVDQVTGPAAAAKALRPGGVVALWWNRPGELTGPTWDAIRAAYQQHAPDVGANSVAMNWSGTDSSTESAQWQGFSPWTRRDYEWVKTYDSTSYPALVQTHSDHVLLPAAQREALVAAVADVIREHGDRLEYRYRTVLLHAHRAG